MRAFRDWFTRETEPTTLDIICLLAAGFIVELSWIWWQSVNRGY